MSNMLEFKKERERERESNGAMSVMTMKSDVLTRAKGGQQAV